jgi:hypothetical protein
MFEFWKWMGSGIKGFFSFIWNLGRSEKLIGLGFLQMSFAFGISAYYRMLDDSLHFPVVAFAILLMVFGILTLLYGIYEGRD